ncbi:MAG: flavodoxin domain-containing protein [Promethearchaeati archaeon SRVP18_Atabeyarchaeia-1]
MLVVYETKYGNTKIVAEGIVAGLKTGKGLEVDLRELKEIDVKRIPSYDAILVGSPNHVGGPTRGIKKFIDQLGKLNLSRKHVAVFDTCSGNSSRPSQMQAVKKMENSLTQKVSGLKLISPGLSIRVSGMKGPIINEDLAKCQEFGKRIAAELS